MQHETREIIRSTMKWGLGGTVGSAILRVLGIPIEPLAVAVGASYAIGGVYFYAIVVGALFGQAGSMRRFALWLPLKIALFIGLVLFARGQSSLGMFSLVGGSLVFIPAAFRYALAESRRAESADLLGSPPPDED
jgi:hypothetical protein